MDWEEGGELASHSRGCTCAVVLGVGGEGRETTLKRGNGEEERYTTAMAVM